MPLLRMKKNRRLPVFHALVNALLQRLNRGVQSTLVSSCLVLVDDALVCHAVNNWHCRIIGLGGGSAIAFCYSGINLLDVGANHGSE